MFLLSRPSPERLQRALAEASAQAPTFDHIGATKSDTKVPGYHYDAGSIEVGHGDAAWHAAIDGLRAWAAHANIGALMTPPQPELVEGETVISSLAIGPMHVLIPCRIVRVVDEPNEFGFAYATLPGHPARGEEAFMLRRDGTGAITFTVSAHSRPADLLSRLGTPVTRFMQRRSNNGYLTGLAAFVERTR